MCTEHHPAVVLSSCSVRSVGSSLNADSPIRSSLAAATWASEHGSPAKGQVVFKISGSGSWIMSSTHVATEWRHPMAITRHPYHEDVDRLDRTGEAFAWLVEQIGDDQWDLPTPCREWSVRDLVAHVASIAEDLVPLALGDPLPAPVDASGLRSGMVVAGGIRRAVEAGVRQWRGLHLSEPRVFPWGTTPAVRAVQFTVVEFTGHGWDLATATGGASTATFEDDDVEAAIDVALRHLPGAARPGLFDPPAPRAGASVFDGLAAVLGRRVAVAVDP
jgi:uncharacterized protein (TIGR03086 family)